MGHHLSLLLGFALGLVAGIVAVTLQDRNTWEATIVVAATGALSLLAAILGVNWAEMRQRNREMREKENKRIILLKRIALEVSTIADRLALACRYLSEARTGKSLLTLPIIGGPFPIYHGQALDFALLEDDLLAELTRLYESVPAAYEGVRADATKIFDRIQAYPLSATQQDATIITQGILGLNSGIAYCNSIAKVLKERAQGKKCTLPDVKPAGSIDDFFRAI